MVVVGLEGGFGEGGSGGWLEPASKSLPTCFLVGGGPWQHPSRICKAGFESSAELALRSGQLSTWGVDGAERGVEDAVMVILVVVPGRNRCPGWTMQRNASPCS